MGRNLQFHSRAQRVLVTGGAGYVGSHTVCELLDQGYQVFVYDDLSGGKKEFVDSRANLIVGCLSEGKRLARLLRDLKISAVVHFAGFIDVAESVREPAKYYQNNFTNTQILLEAMRESQVARLVFSSTASVYGMVGNHLISEDHVLEPNHPYGRSKMLAEMAISDYSKSYGIGYSTLRYFNVAGAHPNGHLGEAHEPETHLIPLILKAISEGDPVVKVYGHRYPTSDGTCVRDFVHVMDVARAHVLALRHVGEGLGEVFNVGSGGGSSVLEVIRTCERVTGASIKIEWEQNRAGDVPILVAGQEKLKKLGWRPKDSALEQIVIDAWKWHNSQNFLSQVRRPTETVAHQNF